VAIVRDGMEFDELTGHGEAEVVLDRTPFYAEGGGQVGDQGVLREAGGGSELFTVGDTQRPLGGLIVQRGMLHGRLRVGETVDAVVDAERRAHTMRNHTGTHLLHRALRNVVGERARQAGSLVTPDYLRFDFPFDRGLTDDERHAIEDEVRRIIRDDRPVSIAFMSMQDAIEGGADAFFDEKYGETVRTIRVQDYSFELCGGTHCRATGQIGGFIAAWILARDRDWFGWLATSQAAAGVAATVSLNALMWTLRQGWSTNEIAPAVIIAILPSAILMGIGFPLTIGIAVKPYRRSAVAPAKADGARIGGLYAGNMGGAIAGSLLTGFVLLPMIGSTASLESLASLYVATGVWLLWFARHRAVVGGVVAVMIVALVSSTRRMPDPFRVGIERRYGTTVSEIWRDEGVQTTASVHANTFQRVLYLDGLHQANDQPGMVQLHRTIAHLPMVLHAAPIDALVIGLGGGATSGAISQHAGAKVEIVELSQSVARAAALFAHVNYDVLTRPNVHLRIDDGRNFLLTTDRQFDVIAADIIQPGHAGAGLVYSQEYFTLVRHALREDGVAMQWIGQRPPAEYKLIMRTFLDVFPDATLWHGGALMVGTKRPLRLSPSAFERHREDPATRAALDEAQITDFEAVRRLYTAGPEQMRAFVGSGELLTDNRPLVEYAWVPSDQPPLDLSSLKADVALIVVDAGQAPQ
jgi:Ser-tRNA(Ala) deacylase AlaX/spermidine synthase